MFQILTQPRSTSRGKLSAISFIAVSMVKDPMGVDLNIREVHEEYLREHPEVAGHDPGVAGELAR